MWWAKGIKIKLHKSDGILIEADFERKGPISGNWSILFVFRNDLMIFNMD